MGLTEADKQTAVAFFRDVQARLTAALEAVDGGAKFVHQPWQKENHADGGGEWTVLRGKVVEKAGVNVSAVKGARYPALEGEHAGKPYFAAGVSTIAHLDNPYAPIGHMNVRLIEVGDGFWVGGGADLTPFIPFEDDTRLFHRELEVACSVQGADAYAKYRAWCDEYFYIKHRESIRGVGGVFFDYVKGDFPALFEFLQRVANAYVRVYPEILARRVKTPFTPEEKDRQLYWRGRYAEFNLVYDRGTKFGLMTGGNIDAIFVSLPPVVKW